MTYILLLDIHHLPVQFHRNLNNVTLPVTNMSVDFSYKISQF